MTLISAIEVIVAGDRPPVVPLLPAHDHLRGRAGDLFIESAARCRRDGAAHAARQGVQLGERACSPSSPSRSRPPPSRDDGEIPGKSPSQGPRRPLDSTSHATILLGLRISCAGRGELRRRGVRGRALFSFVALGAIFSGRFCLSSKHRDVHSAGRRFDTKRIFGTNKGERARARTRVIKGRNKCIGGLTNAHAFASSTERQPATRAKRQKTEGARRIRLRARP